MKIELVSDLHLEFHNDRDYIGVRPVPGADVPVVAGDIGVGTDAVARFRHWPVPVIYVQGNHELYAGADLDVTHVAPRDACAGSAVHFLEKECVVLPGFPRVRFLGTCLWTDYLLFGRERQSYCMDACADFLRDHALIPTRGGKFMPRGARRHHDEARHRLAAQLDLPFPEKTVVVSHHAPHWNSIAERYRREPASAGFASDLSCLLGGADLWLHGHTHDSVDYTVGTTRVFANPRGYPQKNGPSENPRFDEHLIVTA